LAGGKWIHDLKAMTPVADAARHALTVRLEVVRDCLPLALHEADRDSEHVHQLRVGTRRARAALDIFACCLPAKVHRRARKQLRHIRRLAGEARDWDVFLANLTEWGLQQKSRLRPGADCLTGYAVAQRAAAQVRLEEAGQDYPFAFDRFLAETVAAVHRPDDPHLVTLLDLARPLLTGLLEKLDQAASRNLDDYEHLHQVRILGKRLRYAMEVFADCFALAFREKLYPMVEQMQEVLGNANDSYVAGRRLEALSARLQALVPAQWKRLRPGLEGLQRYHQARLPQERQHFQDWWERWQRLGGEAAFFHLLEGPSDRLVEAAAPPLAPPEQGPVPGDDR